MSCSETESSKSRDTGGRETESHLQQIKITLSSEIATEPFTNACKFRVQYFVPLPKAIRLSGESSTKSIRFRRKTPAAVCIRTPRNGGLNRFTMSALHLEVYLRFLLIVTVPY